MQQKNVFRTSKSQTSPDDLRVRLWATSKTADGGFMYARRECISGRVAIPEYYTDGSRAIGRFECRVTVSGADTSEQRAEIVANTGWAARYGGSQLILVACFDTLHAISKTADSLKVQGFTVSKVAVKGTVKGVQVNATAPTVPELRFEIHNQSPEYRA